MEEDAARRAPRPDRSARLAGGALGQGNAVVARCALPADEPGGGSGGGFNVPNEPATARVPSRPPPPKSRARPSRAAERPSSATGRRPRFHSRAELRDGTVPRDPPAAPRRARVALAAPTVKRSLSDSELRRRVFYSLDELLDRTRPEEPPTAPPEPLVVVRERSRCRSDGCAAFRNADEAALRGTRPESS